MRHLMPSGDDRSTPRSRPSSVATDCGFGPPPYSVWYAFEQGGDCATMTFRSPIERVDPPHVSSELDTLNSWLDYERATLLLKLEGLTAEQAGQRTLPSDTTLHGILRHLTTIEQWWFVECVAGSKEPYPYYDGEEIDWDWDLSRSEGLQADVDRYLALCERIRGITADVDPNATITTKRGRVMDIRGIMIGMTHEYARHNGHADVVRELIDGVTGE